MATIGVQEVKRRGISVVDKALEDGPVHLVKSNTAEYVVMSERDYQQLMDDLSEARLAASGMDLKAGRIKRGSARKLMKAITAEK